MYNIVLEKISEVLLAQYYRWIKDNKQKESLEALNRWVSEEAEYQTHAAEIKRGFTRGKDEREHEGKSGSWRDNIRRKSFGTKTSSDDVKSDKPCVASDLEMCV